MPQVYLIDMISEKQECWDILDMAIISIELL